MLNRLFQDKLDEPTTYPSDVQKLIGKVERPDRIYGLRRPAGFKQGQEELESLVKLSLYKQNADFMIFPFLVLEAKTDSSRDSFKDINLQSSCAIMEALRIQYELTKAAGKLGSEHYHGPLVWYVAYKGPLWILHIAFTEIEGEELSYVSVLLL